MIHVTTSNVLVIRPWQTAHSMPIKCARVPKTSWVGPDFLGMHILSCKKKNNITRSVNFLLNRSNNEKLKWIPNCTVNSTDLKYFDDTYIPNGIKTDLFTHGLWNISVIACIKAGQRCIQDPFKHLQWSFLQKYLIKNH